MVPASVAFQEEPRFVFREYRYILSEGGWILELKVSFWEPWVSGGRATIYLDFEVKEARGDTQLHIISATITLDTISTSSYVGVFEGIGVRRSATLTLEITEHKYSDLKPGDYKLGFFKLIIEGYIRGSEGVTEFAREYSIPFIVASPGGFLRVIVEAPSSNRLGDNVKVLITLMNRGNNIVYHVDIKVYVNNSLIETIYYPIIDPGSMKILTINFEPKVTGVHVITAIVRYLTQEYGYMNLTSSAVVHVKSRHIIVLSSIVRLNNNSWARVKGIVSPPVSTPVFIEESSDGIIWDAVATVTPREDGLFEALINVKNKKSTLIRARLPDSLKNFEVISNTVNLTNTMKSLETPIVETRTITYTITQTISITSYHKETTRTSTTTVLESTGTETRSYILAGILTIGILAGASLFTLFRRRGSLRG